MNSNNNNNSNLKNSIPTDKLANGYKRPEHYTYCDICNWNGYPCEKIVVRNFRIRPEDEDSFIYDYTEYDYDPLGKSKIIHVHKFNPKIIEEQVRIALEYQKGLNDVK